MDDALRVREVDGAGELFDEVGGDGGRLRLAGDAPGETAALDEFQREIRQAVVFADLVNLHDVRVAQPGDGAGLAVEARQLRLVSVGAGENHLERDQAVEGQLPRLVDDAHAAAADLFEDRVAGNDGQRQWRVGLAARRLVQRGRCGTGGLVRLFSFGRLGRAHDRPGCVGRRRVARWFGAVAVAHERPRSGRGGRKGKGIATRCPPL